jgi:hypothetical protein
MNIDRNSRRLDDPLNMTQSHKHAGGNARANRLDVNHSYYQITKSIAKYHCKRFSLQVIFTAKFFFYEVRISCRSAVFNLTVKFFHQKNFIFIVIKLSTKRNVKNSY